MNILIIEDERGISNFLKQGLEEEGYVVFLANNGVDGLKIAITKPIDLVLLDWMIPKLTGIQVCKKIREEKKDLPILFLTAKDTLQETIEGLKAGANDYIKKPFSFEELLERIKIHFRIHDVTSILILGNIVLNKNTYEVKVDDEEVALTQREFELLSYLIENKGNVCTRTQIIQKVWKIHFDYDTGVIDVFMNAIRKKIVRNNHDFIKTIRGVGYIAND